MKTVALFDIDGTLFRDSLLIVHFKELLKEKLIPQSYQEQIEPLETAWKNRELDYNVYLTKLASLYGEALKNISVQTCERTAQNVIEKQAKKLYVYTHNRLKWHQAQGHEVIIISGSPSFLVEKLAKKLNINYIYATEYQKDNNRYTGQLKPMYDAQSKTSALANLPFEINFESSYAYGDTTSDMPLFEAVGNPITINPSKQLIKQLNTKNLNVIVALERKDLSWIFKLQDYNGDIL